MNSLRKVIITSFHERIVTVRRSGTISAHTCHEYGCEGLMVSASYAAALTKQSLRTICRRLEAGEIHYYESSDGLFICLTSLNAE